MRTLCCCCCSHRELTSGRFLLRRTACGKYSLVTITLVFAFLITRQVEAGSPKLTKRQLVSINRCLATSNEVGCDTFECLERADRCDLAGMKTLCRKFTRKGGSFTKLGKRFVKKSLGCMTSEIKTGFSTWGRQCKNIENNIARVQSNCYRTYNVCEIASANHKTLKAILPPSDVLTERPSLRLLQSILSCNEKVAAKFRDAVTSVLGQSFLSTLHYMQKGASTSLVNIFGDLARWSEFEQYDDGTELRR